MALSVNRLVAGFTPPRPPLTPPRGLVTPGASTALSLGSGNNNPLVNVAQYGGGSGTSTSTNQTLAWSSNAVGDIGIALITTNSNSFNISSSNSWTKFVGYPISTNMEVTVWWKVLDSTDVGTGAIWTIPIACKWAVAGFGYRAQGIDTASPISQVVGHFKAGTGITTFDLPRVRAAGPRAVLLGWACMYGGTGGGIAPTFPTDLGFPSTSQSTNQSATVNVVSSLATMATNVPVVWETRDPLTGGSFSQATNIGIWSGWIEIKPKQEETAGAETGNESWGKMFI